MMNTTPMPFARAYAPTLEELNASFDDLTFLELVGVGIAGAVYKAAQDKLDRVVIVRIMPRRFSRDEAFLESFTSEAQTLGKLTHGSLMTVYDFGVADEMLFMLTECVEGVSLHDQLKFQLYGFDETLNLAVKLADALKYSHAMGALHKAMSTRSVVFDSKGNVKLIGFSMSSFYNAEDGAYDRQFAAPETLGDEATIDARADIYSFGVLLLKSLTGMFPMEYAQAGAPYQHLLGDLYPVIYHCIRSNPEHRYQSMTEVLQQLQELKKKFKTHSGVIRIAT